MLGLDLTYLWPDARSAEEIRNVGQAEVVAFYPHRSVAPRAIWTALFEKAAEHLDVLVYSGFWLSEHPGLHQLIRRKASSGTAVRFALGDPDSDEVARRGEDEGIGDALAGKIRNALVNFRDLIGDEGVEFRLHGTVLYNSLYRADDELFVNTHIYGMGAYLAPVMHLRRVPGADLFSTYADSFEKVWADASPLRSFDDIMVA